MAQTYFLPPLPFAYDALEPAISTQIMELHHAKHHNTYVANLNKALQDQMEAIKAGNIIDQFQRRWTYQSLALLGKPGPLKTPETKVDAAPKLWEAIQQQWGEDDDSNVFRQKFSEALLGIRGSGWGWLVRKGNQGPLAIVAKDEIPILGIDMWEHAYYLQYLNGKAAYVENIWSVINWKTAEARYLGGSVDSFKDLRASI